MPAITAKAPAKIILFGEHSVVYGRPAIAIPVRQISVRAIVKPAPGSAKGSVRIKSPSIELDSFLSDLPDEHPVSAIVHKTLSYLGVDSMPACTIRISSTIPIAAGLGSGAAVSVALARGVAAFLGQPLTDEEISTLAFEIESIHHGTPSGIDNTVIAFNKPIYFVKEKPLEFLNVSMSLQFIIADTGVPSPTLETVGNVRVRWQNDPAGYNSLFDQAAEISRQARTAMEQGEVETLGRLMNENQRILEKIGVSSPELEHLIRAARQAGVYGAKLSGGGGGGNIVALVSTASQDAVSRALLSAGAALTISTSIN